MCAIKTIRFRASYLSNIYRSIFVSSKCLVLLFLDISSQLSSTIISVDLCIFSLSQEFVATFRAGFFGSFGRDVNGIFLLGFEQYVVSLRLPCLVVCIGNGLSPDHMGERPLLPPSIDYT